MKKRTYVRNILCYPKSIMIKFKLVLLYLHFFISASIYIKFMFNTVSEKFTKMLLTLITKINQIYMKQVTVLKILIIFILNLLLK